MSVATVAVAGTLTGVLTRIERWFAPARDVLRPILSDPRVLAAWGVLVVGPLGVLWWDLRARIGHSPRS